MTSNAAAIKGVGVAVRAEVARKGYAMFDLIVRNGVIVDGSGREPIEGDIAVQSGRIAAIGEVGDRGVQEVDAKGLLVTPGFVDIHTHYDGQVTWEESLQPSSGHGVSTVIMGNCGVGFAPVRAHERDLIVKLMEGVEDIPEAVMTEGIPWNWETFPDYLDALEQRRADIDFGAQLPHNPLRVYVMGARGAACEPPTDDDLAQMRRLTAEAVRSGALGVTTTRNLAHRFRDGGHVPTVTSAEREILALAEGLRDADAGVFEILTNTDESAAEQIGLLRRIANVSGRPVSFSLAQSNGRPGEWRTMLKELELANQDGLAIRGQVLPRPVGMLLGLSLSLNPFSFHPTFRRIENGSLEEKVRALRSPDVRSQLLSETSDDPHAFFKSIVDDTGWLFPLGDPPNYHPALSDSIAYRARASGVSPAEIILDELLRDGGRAILYRPGSNREGERFEGAGAELMGQPHTVLGLGDGGAHYGMICDAAYTTYLLEHWVQHPDPAKRVPLPKAIKMLARDPAQAVGLNDRGVLALGKKADINVIDLGALKLHAPRVSHDLPAGGRRLTQKADGYAVSIVSGEITYRSGVSTKALPGRLVRGARP